MKKIISNILKSPLYLFKTISNKAEEYKINRYRKTLKPKFDIFEVVHGNKKDFEKWLNNIFKKEGFIGIILGSRGSGKSALALKFVENFYAKTNSKLFAIGFKKNHLPFWINPIEDIKSIPNNSTIVIDEGGILFNSRNSMSKLNKMLSELLLISRHKKINIIFISQNSSNIDVNILRQADFLILKKPSLLQSEFERKIIQKIYSNISKKFQSFENSNEISYIHGDEFRGFVKTPLPSFWNEKLSRSFA